MTTTRAKNTTVLHKHSNVCSNISRISKQIEKIKPWYSQTCHKKDINAAPSTDRLCCLYKSWLMWVILISKVSTQACMSASAHIHM